jgi:hypothetical protein
MIISVFRMTLDSTFHPEEPNKTKPPLQVLAVVEGKSKKIRFRINHVMGEIIELRKGFFTSLIGLCATSAPALHHCGGPHLSIVDGRVSPSGTTLLLGANSLKRGCASYI